MSRDERHGSHAPLLVGPRSQGVGRQQVGLLFPHVDVVQHVPVDRHGAERKNPVACRRPSRTESVTGTSQVRPSRSTKRSGGADHDRDAVSASSTSAVRASVPPAGSQPVHAPRVVDPPADDDLRAQDVAHLDSGVAGPSADRSARRPRRPRDCRSRRSTSGSIGRRSPSGTYSIPLRRRPSCRRRSATTTPRRPRRRTAEPSTYQEVSSLLAELRAGRVDVEPRAHASRRLAGRRRDARPADLQATGVRPAHAAAASRALVKARRPLSSPVA